MAGDARLFHTPPIPGERDPHNLTTRAPGAVSARFTGEDIPPSSHQPWLDEITATEHAREGGMRRKKTTKKY